MARLSEGRIHRRSTPRYWTARHTAAAAAAGVLAPPLPAGDAVRADDAGSPDRGDTHTVARSRLRDSASGRDRIHGIQGTHIGIITIKSQHLCERSPGEPGAAA
ncbi:hypothetical protein F5B17DRAFT_429523 [Nemania serpens]|nr:hypothetical protein F5B17DRAFT_429523 [Nemania serpens]